VKRDLPAPDTTKPILLYNDECAVCRAIGGWVTRESQTKSDGQTLVVRPIGDRPDELRELNPDLDIWDAYATIHLLMPDGSMKLGGEAVAEVFRRLAKCRWFCGCFRLNVCGFRPFQAILNLGYAILSAVRPMFGCESCGTPNLWTRRMKMPHFTHFPVASAHTRRNS
jgi:predicted DCC family thiol-disulfide oxidoreductase YuxK